MPAPSVIGIAQKIGRAAADLIWPPQCLVSRQVVGAPGAVAHEHWTDLTFIDAPVCARCGSPFAADIGEDAVCAPCVARPPTFDRARAALAYSDAAGRMLVQFKWGDRFDGVATFAAWMARAGHGLIAECDLLVPVPLHFTRFVMRHFNQSALLAEALQRQTGRPVDVMALQRVRRTSLQRGLAPDARRRNVRRAFRVRDGAAERVRGRQIVLVDDVLTTGATADACAKTLKAAGAAGVDVITVARVVSPQRISI